MSAVTLGLITFACCAIAAMLGLQLHRQLPEHHLDAGSKDVMKLVLGLIATIAALVLSLLIASAKSTYDTQQTELQQLAADAVELDRVLADYGPEGTDARRLFGDIIRNETARLWPSDGAPTRPNAALPTLGTASAAFLAALRRLHPVDATQTFLQQEALRIGANIVHTRALMFEQSAASFAWPLLIVLLFWVSVLFLGFGMLVGANPTVRVALLTGAAAVAGAIFLMLEMSSPYEGVMRLSDAPLRAALSMLGQ